MLLSSLYFNSNLVVFYFETGQCSPLCKYLVNIALLFSFFSTRTNLILAYADLFIHDLDNGMHLHIIHGQTLIDWDPANWAHSALVTADTAADRELGIS